MYFSTYFLISQHRGPLPKRERSDDALWRSSTDYLQFSRFCKQILCLRKLTALGPMPSQKAELASIQSQMKRAAPNMPIFDRAHFRHIGDVRAGDKGPFTGAGDDNYANFCIFFDFLEYLVEFTVGLII